MEVFEELNKALYEFDQSNEALLCSYVGESQ